MKPPATKVLALVFFLTIILSGCSSSGGGSGSSAAPTATLTASPTSFTAGQGSSLLTFGSTNASEGSINQGVGAVGVKGSVRVTPSITTIYTYTATGPGGTATASATVTVLPAGPAPTATLTASPSAIIAGQSVTLSWTTTNATSIAISNVTDSSCTTPPCAVQPVLSGSILVTPTTQTSYVATVTGNGQQVNSAAAVVSVNALTSFDGLAADPTNLGTEPQDVDPNGAIGTKQFVEYVNLQYQAYDKITHAPVWSMPQPIGTPWTAAVNLLGDDPNCDGHPASDGSLTGIHLDAVVDFDRIAKRWVIVGKSDLATGYYLCLAVSNTDDLSSPTLGWYGYDYAIDNLIGDTTNPEQPYFPDWAKLGIWGVSPDGTSPGPSDGYYVTFDIQYIPSGYAEVGGAVCVFDRDDILLQGTASPPTVLGPLCQTLSVTLDPTSHTFLGHSLIPADIDGTTAPPSTRPEYMIAIENPSITNNQTTSNSLNLWEAQVNWATSSLTLTRSTLTAGFDTYTPGCYLYDPTAPAITNCVQEPQNGGPQIIDSVGDRLMPRFPYRNFGSHESYLISHTVQTGPGASGSGSNPLFQTGVRWYELRVDSGGMPYVYQSNTINPDQELFRFLPSIAQDSSGNAAVGYSFSNQLTNPGIDFSYWSLGTIGANPTEITILNGPAEQVTSGNNGVGEWGTYSGMSVDPTDGCTFWYVNEYYAVSSDSGWSTRIANFQVPGCQ